MSRPIRKIAAGSRVFFRIEVRDLSDDDHPLTSPSNAPTIELRDPEGTVKVNFTGMTAGVTGIYTHTYQTASTDVLGIWQVRFKVTVASDIDLTPAQDAFELVA